MIHIVGFLCFFAVCLAYVLRCGGAPERAAMLSQAVAMILTMAAINVLPYSASFHGLATGLAVIDISLLVALCCIALRANRIWPIVLAGLQLSTVLAHLSKAVFPAFPEASYGIFEQFWAWPMLVTTTLGTRSHWQRVGTFGAEPDWKPLWPHSLRAGSTT